MAKIEINKDSVYIDEKEYVPKNNDFKAQQYLTNGYIDLKKSEAIREQYKKERAEQPPIMPKIPIFPPIDKKNTWKQLAKFWTKFPILRKYY